MKKKSNRRPRRSARQLSPYYRQGETFAQRRSERLRRILLIAGLVILFGVAITAMVMAYNSGQLLPQYGS